MMHMYEANLLQEEDLNSLEHYGIKGQKWGQRRFQNPDGSYTELGKERRRVGYQESDEKKEKEANANANGIEATETTDGRFGGKAYKDMTRKELRAAKKRARHNEKERRVQREFNRDKREAIENGDLTFISKNISKFTNEEIDESIQRYNKMQNLRTLENANKKGADYFIDKATHFLEKADKLSTPIFNMANKAKESSKKSVELQKAKTDLDKAETELQYLKDPKSKPKSRKEEIEAEKAEKELQWFYKPETKPLTEADSLKNAKQALENRKLIRENEQMEIDTKWKQYMDEEKRKNYETMSVTDFKNKWGSYDNSGGGGKGGGGGKNNKPSKDDFTESMRKIKPDITDEEAEKMYKSAFSGQAKKDSSLTGWFSKKTKEDTKGTDFDLDDHRVNIVTRKYLNQLKSSPKDYWKENSVQNDQWKKDLKKHDAEVIDKWVKDMKKKYMKEQKLDSKAAEKKAEEYVDSWLDAYDEGDI